MAPIPSMTQIAVQRSLHSGRQPQTITAQSPGGIQVTATVKYYQWRDRYGKANEDNVLVPRDHWLEPWEKDAIIDFHHQFPLEGYRTLSFMMLDHDIVAVSPSSSSRALKGAQSFSASFARPWTEIILHPGLAKVSQRQTRNRLRQRPAVRCPRPQSNGKIERWHKSLKTDCIRPGVALSLQDARRLVTSFVGH